jgi:hypothetical protein
MISMRILEGRRTILTLIIALLPLAQQAQDISGAELLNRAIAFHDPNGNWKTFQGKLSIEMISPKDTPRLSLIFLDLPKGHFESHVRKDGHTIKSIINKEGCKLLLNDSPVIADTYRERFKITCERAQMMKDYYTYLYGLPMKLKDSGTQIDPKVTRINFKGKDYLRLKVTYEKQVGDDTWYFYFDPQTYAMQAYQFFHNESANDGEYILLEDLMEVNNIKMPRVRAWYYNRDNSYLGTDTIRKGGPLK